MMDGVVAEKKIQAWLPFAYDWRMNVSDIVSGSVLYSTTTKSLITEIEKLTQNSKTGKVSIVAHSNGGLVAKALGKELERQGKLGLIDKVIFVGVPQLGTPQAVASLLHGYDESYLGTFPDKGVMRSLGLNMLGAYGLLPSPEYFDKAIAPIISFAGTAVSSYNSFTDFLTAKINKRTQPKESDLTTPAVLSQNLLSKAQTLHTSLDPWNFPSPIQSISISGWGRSTTDSITYLNNTFSIGKTIKGDGTVVTNSSKGSPISTLFFNEGSLQHDTRKKIDHATILEGEPVRKVLSDLITKNNTASLSDLNLPSYVSRQEPNPDDFPYLGSLVVSVHSPVDIEVFDNHGGHIGLVPLKDVASGHEDSDLMWLDDTIGADYEELGSDKYITLPTYTGDTYTVKLKGTGTGTFTFNIQKFDSSRHEISSTTYADLPVTPLLVASTTLTALTLNPVLNIDVDGNGKTDIQAKPATTSDPLIHLEAMKQVILSLKLKPLTEKALLLKIDVLKILMKNNKSNLWVKRLKALSEKRGTSHWSPKGLTEENRKILSDMFEAFLESMGSK
jgi:pimeloyl-ACP methyl ester carboxylesterase